jgi:hypothetical protein
MAFAGSALGLLAAVGMMLATAAAFWVLPTVLAAALFLLLIVWLVLGDDLN